MGRTTKKADLCVLSSRTKNHRSLTNGRFKSRDPYLDGPVSMLSPQLLVNLHVLRGLRFFLFNHEGHQGTRRKAQRQMLSNSPTSWTFVSFVVEAFLRTA